MCPDPMFLIDGGRAVVMKLKFSASDTAADPTILFDVVLDQDEDQGGADAFFFPEGMRVVDAGEGLLVVAATSHATIMDNTNYNYQMAAVGLSSEDGTVLWRRAYPASNASAGFGNGAANGTMSHPYALTLAEAYTGHADDPSDDLPAGVVIAGHAYGDTTQTNFPNPVGRMLRLSREGTPLWDSRFREGNPDHNVECYGVAPACDGGFIATCGFGCMTCDKRDTPQERTWQVLNHRTNGAGEQLWEHLYTNTSGGNNAGEFIIARREGGYATYVDSQTWGSGDTGGNFGLLITADDCSKGEGQSVSYAITN